MEGICGHHRDDMKCIKTGFNFKCGKTIWRGDLFGCHCGVLSVYGINPVGEEATPDSVYHAEFDGYFDHQENGFFKTDDGILKVNALGKELIGSHWNWEE